MKWNSIQSILKQNNSNENRSIYHITGCHTRTCTCTCMQQYYSYLQLMLHQKIYWARLCVKTKHHELHVACTYVMYNVHVYTCTCICILSSVVLV